ncbi:MAG: glycosyltransferase, partial [Flavobacteriaceae bacterium]|nr:glycosyltransferase [Flavobacteriaceae bacterium]
MKKALIISYYWPPAGGPGVQRWLKFVKYLRDFGVEPVVYVPENPSYPLYDYTLFSEVPKDITILRKPIKEPYKFAKLISKKKSKTISKGIIQQKKQQTLIDKILLYIRGNFFIPDARKSWVKPSLNFLLQYIIENDINTIITTGPPHSLHLIGLNLKDELGIKWLADFRDPWTTIGYHKELKLTPKVESKHKILESNVLHGADEIIVTSNYTKDEFSTKAKQPITVITNGYDTHSVTIDKKDDKFTFSHIGSLLSERNPIILWQAISDLISENGDFANE